MHVFHREFFEIIKKTIVKHLRRISGKYHRDCWSKISFFSPLRFFILSDSIPWTFSCDERIYQQTFIKGLRNSWKFLEICALLSAWYGYLHNFFPCSFHIIFIVEELMVEVRSFGFRRSSLIIFIFLLNHEELYWLEIRDFHIEIRFVQLILVMHRS